MQQCRSLILCVEVFETEALRRMNLTRKIPSGSAPTCDSYFFLFFWVFALTAAVVFNDRKAEIVGILGCYGEW